MQPHDDRIGGFAEGHALAIRHDDLEGTDFNETLQSSLQHEGHLTERPFAKLFVPSGVLQKRKGPQRPAPPYAIYLETPTGASRCLRSTLLHAVRIGCGP